MRYATMLRMLLCVPVILLVAAPVAAAASLNTPCSSVEHVLTNGHKAKLETVIARQLNVPNVEIIRYFGFAHWSVVYIDSRDADETFLFYDAANVRRRYINTWSGATGYDEERDMLDWTLKNVPKIPMHLAECFSWYVTKGRDR